MDTLLSITEAADILGVHPETLRRWDREGKLQAVKVGERGDRKYRREDLLRILAEQKAEPYKGYLITPHSSGFEISPGTLIRIASFLVSKDDLVSAFAFAEGMFVRMSHPHLKDEDLMGEAMGIIKRFIDNEQVENLEEYTFEFHPTNFIQVNNPKWWTKTMKSRYE